MPSDFAVAGRAARELIPVPDLSMDAIRRRSRAVGAGSRLRALAAYGAMTLGVVGGVGFGAQIYNGVHVWLTGDNAVVIVHSFVMMRQPMANELTAGVAKATFPVVFPMGIPAGNHVNLVFVSPAEHPSTVVVQYRNERTKHEWGFTLLDPAAVSADSLAPIAGGARPQSGAVYQWRVGGEVVMIPKRVISSDEVNRIKSAMEASTPQQSLAVTRSMLSQVAVLGGDRVEIAEQYAQRGVRSVLLGEQVIRSVARHVKRDEPIFDTRVTSISEIPYVNGKPDYSSHNVRVSWPKNIAISAGGVRAIDAVMGFEDNAKDRDACKCEVLFSQPNASTYWIWKIPLNGPGEGKKYSVDAQTLAVTPAT